MEYKSEMSYDISHINIHGGIESHPTQRFDQRSLQEFLGNLLFYMSDPRYTVETEQKVTEIGNVTQTVTKVTVTQDDGHVIFLHTYELEKVNEEKQ
jgi:hypothetical protein